MRADNGSFATRVLGKVLLGCTAVLFASGAAALDLSVPRPGDMTRYELPGYTLVTVDNAQLRRDMTKLPMLKRALEISMGIDVKDTGIPTFFYVVSGTMWDRYLEISTGIPTDFIPTRFTNYVIANSVAIDREQLFHEHARLYVYNQMPGIYPLWFEEGLAHFFDRGQYSPSNVRMVPRTGSDVFNWLPTQQVLRATRTSPEYLDERYLYGFAYQTRVMVQRALVDDAEFGKQVFRYVAAINELKSLDEAEKELGSIDDLDLKMHDYVNKSGLKKITLKLDGVSDLELPAGTPLSKVDALLGIATVSLDIGSGIDRVHELLDAADKEPGGAAHALPIRMRLAARLKDDAELDKLDVMLGKEPLDAVSTAIAGIALYERAESVDRADPRRNALLTRSFERLDRSLTTRPDDPTAVWTFAMVAADLKRDLDVALTRLAPMFKRLPANPDMAQAAALVLQARGGQDVQPYLLAVLRNAHTLEQKRWAAERINALRATGSAAGQ